MSAEGVAAGGALAADPAGPLGSIATRWPMHSRETSEPTAAVVPEASWPRTIGGVHDEAADVPLAVVVNVRTAYTDAGHQHLVIGRARHSTLLDTDNTLPQQDGGAHGPAVGDVGQLLLSCQHCGMRFTGWLRPGYYVLVPRP